MSIRVLYDSLSFDWEHVGGVTRYFTNVWRNLPQDIQYDIAVKTTINLYLQGAPFNVPTASNAFDSFLPSYKFKGKLWLFDTLCKLGILRSSKETNRREFARKLRAGDYDVIHLTGAHSFGDAWRPYVGRKPLIVTVCDLIPDIVYDNQLIKKWRQEVLNAATHIIAISEHTKKDIVSLYGIDSDRISVVYLGADVAKTMKPVHALERKRYIFYVGKRDGYKNFSFLAKSVAPIFAADKSLFLVCTGSDFNDAEKKMLAQYDMIGRASARIYEDDELRWLYANACVFIYPSKYEGFGIPVLDAFSLGCPVLLANASCFPEIGGNAALFFDPADENDLRKQLLRIISENEDARRLCADLVARGKERLKQFSWAKCAQETAEVYRQVVL